MLSQLTRVFVVTACLAATEVALAAGYSFDPSIPRDEKPGNVYFGSAKDANGDFVQGVTVVLQTPMVEYVFVTDITGRFRVELDTAQRPADVKPRCSKAGYQPGRVITRLPPGNALTPVEMNCVLER
jgi:hypothetical protein